MQHKYFSSKVKHGAGDITSTQNPYHDYADMLRLGPNGAHRSPRSRNNRSRLFYEFMEMKLREKKLAPQIERMRSEEGKLGERLGEAALRELAELLTFSNGKSRFYRKENGEIDVLALCRLRARANHEVYAECKRRGKVFCEATMGEICNAIDRSLARPTPKNAWRERAMLRAHSAMLLEDKQ